MNTPLSWVKAYVPELDCTEKEYMDAMTLSGTKVEGYEKFDADLCILNIYKSAGMVYNETASEGVPNTLPVPHSTLVTLFGGVSNS